jgi:hypothetical protein
MDRILAAIMRLMVAVGLLSLSGCPPSPPAASDSPPVGARETWDVYLLQGKRVGYGHTTVRRDAESAAQVVSTENVGCLAIRRADQTTKLEIRSASVETPEGQLIRFESEMHMGPSPRRTIGRVNGKQLDMETTTAGTVPLRESIAWAPEYGGPFAIEQSLLRKPMRPGERRALRTLVVEFNQVADVEMDAKAYEPTALRTGVYELLRIEVVTRLANGQKLENTVWSDRTGDALKAHSPDMGGLTTYRVSKAEALEKADVAELDLMPGAMVKVDRPLPDAHRTKRVRYRVRLKGGDPTSAFITGASQAVKSIDAHTAEVTVYAIRPGQPGGNADARPDKPTADDLRPNSFIQSDDPTIVAEAAKAAGQETDPWRVAVALERYVNREVKKKDYSQAFATAAEVAKSREGDCTEHAVFLAALCRARGIPARVAIGLVYVPGTGAFGYHMWTEVFVDKRWTPIDGTLALGGIGAGHLEIAQTNLKGASAYAAVLPVAQILGRLSIEIVDVQ